MRAVNWEAIGLLAVLLVLTGWLAFFWHLAHTQPTTIERASSYRVFPWEQPRSYRIEGP